MERQRGGTVPDCAACDDADRRARWGCDAPRSEPVWQIACECAGVPRDCTRDDCTEGWRPVLRCPNALVREGGGSWLGRFLSAWALWSEHGRTLDGLPWDEQPAAFAQAVAVANGERAAWQRERDAFERRRAERAAVNRG